MWRAPLAESDLRSSWDETDMRVMLDNSVYAHSQFAEPARGPQGPRFGIHNQQYQVYGFIRKELDPNPEYQAQKNSLFTIGRLIREKTVAAFTYNELRYESLNRVIGVSEFDALADCPVMHCPPALERSRFQLGDFFDFTRKGGKKDRKRGANISLSQIQFMEWLCSLDEMMIAKLLDLKITLGLTDFEVDSLQNLKYFQMLCAIGRSPEHYPDIFHLWTAQRNRIDVFLTLERKLPEMASRAERSMKIEPQFSTKVLRPIEFLQLLDITCPDPIPLERNRFYPFIDVVKLR